MYKPKAIPAIRMQKLLDLPSAEDVSRCMTQAEKMRGRTVELPFSASNAQGDQTGVVCVLAGIWNKEDEAPTWIFYVGDSPKRDARWRHQTRDLGLVASLAQRECLGDQVDVSASDRLSSGKKGRRRRRCRGLGARSGRRHPGIWRSGIWSSWFWRPRRRLFSPWVWAT